MRESLISSSGAVLPREAIRSLAPAESPERESLWSVESRTCRRWGNSRLAPFLPDRRLTFEVTSLVDGSNDDPAARKSNDPRDAGVVGVEPHHLTRADDVS
jgi:hypothetical protein